MQGQGARAHGPSNYYHTTHSRVLLLPFWRTATENTLVCIRCHHGNRQWEFSPVWLSVEVLQELRRVRRGVQFVHG